MTLTEKFFSRFTRVRPGEGRGILLLCVIGFLLTCSYLILKTLREPLILTEFGAETKSYAVAAIAVVLFFVIPLYGVLFRHTNRTQLVITISLFFLVQLVIFYILHRSGISIAFAYFVWIGIFGVMVTAQFWAYATDIYNVKSGQRIFPVLVIATTLGGLVGAQVAAHAYEVVGTGGLMITAGLLLCTSMFFYLPAQAAPPDDSRSIEAKIETPAKGHSLFGGFAVVWNDYYLRLIALFVVLLNWINSTGEYILSVMVVQWAETKAAETGQAVDSLIASFFGNYAFITSLLALLLQTFVVARVIRRFGLPRCLMFLPLITMIGYISLCVLFPIFTIIRVLKVAENGLDSSLMTTIRQSLFLPTSREVKYEGRTTIDTFFWRFGDFIQGGAILIGLNVFNFNLHKFAILNALLAIAWFIVAYLISREYCKVVSDNATSSPPILNKPIEDVAVVANAPFTFALDEDTFVDKDPGGVITLRGWLEDGAKLPKWLSFNPSTRVFSGVPPAGLSDLKVKVTARDYDGLEAMAHFSIRVA